MAIEQCNELAGPELVEKAWREIYGPIAECQSLLTLYGRLGDGDEVSWSCLASGAIERLLASIEEVENVERDFGRLSFSQRFEDHPQ